MSDSPPTVYTVTQLTTSIRAILEHTFPDVWVEGEVSNLRIPSSGHVYFSLNDQQSQIRAVLFRRTAAALPFQVENGLTVLTKGRISVYEPRGDYQLLLEYLEPKGIGALQVAFEQRKKQFEREGLFDSARKRPLPFFPRCVGVITSGTGAALHDIVTVIHRRCPVIRIRVFPVTVQGPGAAEQIADAVRLANQQTDLDVLIVGRGGGSWEDLWSFNEEVVVRAIVGSRIPVISAVGHEIDFTLSDFAADCRTPTPSAAAESVAPVLVDLIAGLQEKNAKLAHAMRGTFRFHRNQVELALRALPVPSQILQRQVQRVDELSFRLGNGIRAMLAAVRPRLVASGAVLERIGAGRSWQQGSLMLPQLLRRLFRAMPWVLTEKKHQLRNMTGTLDTLSPLAILSRGYSILETRPGGKLVKDARCVQVGDRISARLAQGKLSCFVEERQS